MMQAIKALACVAAIASLATTANAQNTWSPGGRANKLTNWVPPTTKFLDRASRIAPRVMPQPYKAPATAFRYGYQAGKVIERRLDLGGKLYRATTRR